MESSVTEVTVHVIIPARNEEDCIGSCLQSLVSQQGIGFEITVVDDGSTDQTREIAESFPGVRVISAAEPLPGVSGKCNAVCHGSVPPWLLLTDADTFHYPGSLVTAVAEAEAHGVDLLSYSPEQEVVSFAERALMPVVFAELARTYPPERVSDPSEPDAAANGQFLLVRRTVYESLGGHTAVQNKVLEDVALAKIFKRSGHKICFRHGAGWVRTRMYRSFPAMWEGWTKNLVVLFDTPLWLAWNRFQEFMLLLLLPIGIFAAWHHHRIAALALCLVFVTMYGLFLRRVRRAHFSWSDNLLSFLGLPLFVSLLLRSWLHSEIRGAVTWKGREYPHS
jgi:glycosyltransferase involved in cell wall biosynthesis